MILASGLAVGAVVALGLTLMASVRRRRRDLAVLRTLGFTQRQLAAAVAWKASVAALVGVIVGVPLGIALGRWLWALFAREIYAVPEPTVPVLQVALVALGAPVLANMVAALPGTQRRSYAHRATPARRVTLEALLRTVAGGTPFSLGTPWSWPRTSRTVGHGFLGGSVVRHP